MSISVIDFINQIQKKDIKVSFLSSDESWNHKDEWFKNFVPADKQGDSLYTACLHLQGFLWNAFDKEIGIIDYVEGDRARDAFDEQCKMDAILLDNNTKKATAYRINDASMITSEDLDMLTDITLTSVNFEWTYSKTHEPYAGPYFYKVQR